VHPPICRNSALPSPLHELPGVGKNLQDHIDYVQSWSVPSNTASFGVSLRGMGKALGAMLEWRKQRTGMITSAIAWPARFSNPSPDVPIPDLQLVFVVALVDDHARKGNT
jgi:choline dehydrogenase-like flavoprotein